jgi:hypothetical protein
VEAGQSRIFFDLSLGNEAPGHQPIDLLIPAALVLRSAHVHSLRKRAGHEIYLTVLNLHDASVLYAATRRTPGFGVGNDTIVRIDLAG